MVSHKRLASASTSMRSVVRISLVGKELLGFSAANDPLFVALPCTVGT